MSLLHQQHRQPQMLPAAGSVPNTRPEFPGCLNRLQNTVDVEAQMALQACQKIEARMKMARLFQQYRAQLTSNKYDVTVTSDPASMEEKICLTVFDNKEVVKLTVKNSGVKRVYLTFWASDFVNNIFTVRDCHGNIINTTKQHTLGPGEAYNIKVHFCSDHGGFYEQLLIFQFKTQKQSSYKFEIMRLLEIKHWTYFSEQLAPVTTNSLCGLRTTKWSPAEGFVLRLLKYVVPLKNYGMPHNIKVLRKCDTDLESPLSWTNYSQRFHLLLHFEEFQLKKELDKYYQYKVPMFRHQTRRDLFILQIAHVSKNSPLRLLGSQVLVTSTDRTRPFERKMYKGWVHQADVEQVYLKFKEMIFKEGMKFTVRFLMNRIPLRIQHRAVALVYRHRLKEVLFPTGQLSSHHSHLLRLVELENNPEQHKAIQHIAASSAKPAPYLVFGPPGTGKTMTLVKAIKQIVKTQASCNILACAPSNSATDHLCEKILEGKIGEHMVYRLYALSVPVRNILKNQELCCNLNHETNTFMIPPKAVLMKHKIMVTTLLTAGRLVTGGIPPGHYSYIFVDEAGQATEAECIIPIAGLWKPQKCQVVLAGDPKQLGPIITCRVAEKNGLGVSLLERLMRDFNLYKSHETLGFNSRFVTKLLRNYRSHPAILKIPNELFYNGELQPYAPKERCSLYCKWERLPKKDFPLIFHGVAGTNERDGNSPSIYNMAEVDVVMEYFKSLVDHLGKKGMTKIGPREIGIISPYRKQVEKIQKALKMDSELKKGILENVLVGSVEQFQGRECNAILVSTVRSNPKLTARNQQFTLGFVNNEKRFNVALTRARALLIVVGDPRALKTDQIWNKFIHYCSIEGGYRGITVSDAEENEEILNAVHSQASVESDSATAGPLLKEPIDLAHTHPNLQYST